MWVTSVLHHDALRVNPSDGALSLWHTRGGPDLLRVWMLCRNPCLLAGILNRWGSDIRLNLPAIHLFMTSFDKQRTRCRTEGVSVWFSELGIVDTWWMRNSSILRPSTQTGLTHSSISLGPFIIFAFVAPHWAPVNCFIHLFWKAQCPLWTERHPPRWHYACQPRVAYFIFFYT